MLLGHWGKAVSHGGSVPGTSSEMLYFPDTQVTVVVLTNGTEESLDEVFEALTEKVVTLGHAGFSPASRPRKGNRR